MIIMLGNETVGGTAGKWHCFDIPFLIMCGDSETASHFRDIFLQYDLSRAERFQISWER